MILGAYLTIHQWLFLSSIVQNTMQAPICGPPCNTLRLIANPPLSWGARGLKFESRRPGQYLQQLTSRVRGPICGPGLGLSGKRVTGAALLPVENCQPRRSTSRTVASRLTIFCVNAFARSLETRKFGVATRFNVALKTGVIDCCKLSHPVAPRWSARRRAFHEGHIQFDSRRRRARRWQVVARCFFLSRATEGRGTRKEIETGLRGYMLSDVWSAEAQGKRDCETAGVEIGGCWDRSRRIVL